MVSMHDQEELETSTFEVAETIARLLVKEFDHLWPTAIFVSEGRVSPSLPSILKKLATEKIVPLFLDTNGSLSSLKTSILFTIENDFRASRVVKKTKELASMTSPEILASFSESVSLEKKEEALFLWKKKFETITREAEELYTLYSSTPSGGDPQIRGRWKVLNSRLEQMKSVQKTNSFEFFPAGLLRLTLQVELDRVCEIVKDNRAHFTSLLKEDQKEIPITHLSSEKIFEKIATDRTQKQTASEDKTLSP